MPQTTAKATNFSRSLGSLSSSPSGSSYTPSIGMNCVQKVVRMLSADAVRLFSIVGQYSLHSLRANSFIGGMRSLSIPSSVSLKGCAHSGSPRIHDSICALVPTTCSGSRKMTPMRETVAGEAAAKSSTSKTIAMYGVIEMTSFDMRVSFLLSSSTVFIDSIQWDSTGPSKTIH